VCVCVCMCVCVCVYVCMCMCVHVRCIHMCVYVCACAVAQEHVLHAHSTIRTRETKALRCDACECFKTECVVRGECMHEYEIAILSVAERKKEEAILVEAKNPELLGNKPFMRQQLMILFSNS